MTKKRSKHFSISQMPNYAAKSKKLKNKQNQNNIASGTKEVSTK